MQDDASPQDGLAAEVSRLAGATGRTVGVAESLTGGMVSAALAAAEAAGEWFKGAVVAYASEVKFDVLGVPAGPVVSAEAAAAMARGARRLLGADIAVAVTGAGGPAPQDGRPPGTVFVAVCDGTGVAVEERAFPGSPAEVCAAATEAALTSLVDRLRVPAARRCATGRSG